MKTVFLIFIITCAFWSCNNKSETDTSQHKIAIEIKYLYDTIVKFKIQSIDSMIDGNQQVYSIKNNFNDPVYLFLYSTPDLKKSNIKRVFKWNYSYYDCNKKDWVTSSESKSVGFGNELDSLIIMPKRTINVVEGYNLLKKKDSLSFFLKVKIIKDNKLKDSLISKKMYYKNDQYIDLY